MSEHQHQVVLQLLASSHGQTLQMWEFTGRPLIHIGRAPECDVVINSPVVSRSHAYLKSDGLQWELCSVSRNGVFVNGTQVTSRVLANNTVFRLASSGPFLRYHQLEQNRCQAMETIPPDQFVMTPLLLDKEKRDREVDELTDGEFFQDLKTLAQQLRQRRN